MKENWLVIVVGIFLLSMMLYGHYRGFIRLSLSVAAIILALVIVNTAMPKISEYLRESQIVHQTVEQGIRKLTELDEGLDTQNPAQQRLYIEGLNLPKQLKEILIENNNNEVYSVLGVDQFIDYIVSYLSDRIINTVGFSVMFLLVLAVLHLLIRWLDLFARLPILSGINKIAGAILGGMEGLLILWILCIVLNALETTQIGMLIMEQIEKSQALTFLWQNNLLSLFFHNMALGI